MYWVDVKIVEPTTKKILYKTTKCTYAHSLQDVVDRLKVEYDKELNINQYQLTFVIDDVDERKTYLIKSNENRQLVNKCSLRY